MNSMNALGSTSDHGNSHTMDTLKLTVHNQGPPELLRPTFQPVVTTLTLSGQYFEWSRRYRISLSFIFCMIIWLFIWFTVIRYGFFYNRQMSPFEASVVALFHAWIIQNACAMTYLHLIGRRRFYEFLRKWQEYREEYKCVELKHFRPHLIKWLAIFWVFTLGSVVLITIIYLHVSMYDLVNLKPFSDSKDIPVPYVILCALLTIYYTFIYFAPVVTLHIFCGSLNAEFEFIGNELKLLLRKMNYATSDALEGMRQRHHVLCRVVAALDGAWSPYLLLSFVFDVPLVAANLLVLFGTGYLPNIVTQLTQVSTQNLQSLPWIFPGAPLKDNCGSPKYSGQIDKSDYHTL